MSATAPMSGSDLGQESIASTPQLSSPRARLLELCCADEPRCVQSLADLTGQHPSTVREHLQGLIAAGLVTREKRRGQGRGRPTWIYRATASAARELDAVTVTVVALAHALADRTGHDLDTVAVEAGRQWGRRLREGQHIGLPSHQDLDSILRCVQRGLVLEHLDAEAAASDGPRCA